MDEKEKVLGDLEGSPLLLPIAHNQAASRTTSTLSRVIRFISGFLLLMLLLSTSIRPLLRTCSPMASSRTVYTASDDVASLLQSQSGNAKEAVRLPPNAIHYKLPSGDSIPSVALGTAGKGETYGPTVAALKDVSLHCVSISCPERARCSMLFAFFPWIASFDTLLKIFLQGYRHLDTAWAYKYVERHRSVTPSPRDRRCSDSSVGLLGYLEMKQK